MSLSRGPRREGGGVKTQSASLKFLGEGGGLKIVTKLALYGMLEIKTVKYI